MPDGVDIDNPFLALFGVEAGAEGLAELWEAVVRGHETPRLLHLLQLLRLHP